MTVPTLAMGISAAGADEVAKLAASVGLLKENLKGLAGVSTGQTIGNLEALAKEFREMRQELNATLQGLRTDLAAGFKQAFDAASRQAKTGGDQVAAEVEKAKVRIKTAASVDVGNGVKSSMSITGFDKASVLKTLQEIASSTEAVIAAENKANNTLMAEEAKLTQRMISAEIAANEKLRLTKEAEAVKAIAEEAKLTQMMIAADIAENQKLRQAKAKEVAQLVAAESELGLRMIAAEIAANEKLRLTREVEAAKTIAEEAKLTQRMIAADISEKEKLRLAREKELSRLVAAESELGLKIIAADIAANEKIRIAKQAEAAELMAAEAAIVQRMIAADIAANERLRASREREANELIAAEAALTQKIIAADLANQEALRRANAAFAAMSDRSRLRSTVRARADLDSGLAAPAVASRFGADAVAGAQSASSLEALRAELDALSSGSAPKASGAMKLVTAELNNAHSAARGLASGFGAMWATWGNVAPLLAGAALSTSFVQVIKQGAQVQNTMTQIRVLAGETQESVAGLNTELFAMARNSQFGPTELATAMKTLALAGLDAKQVFTSVKDVLSFAVAGDTNIEKAADILTTVAVAFNIASDKYGFISDTISKAAAESKSSVESMGAAFKTSSVINQQYGVSLQDVAVGQALLANASIQGTAAGTAMRNMYSDLAGRTPKVEKALKELGVNAIDPLTGKMRGLKDIFKDLTDALAKRTPTAQFKFLQDIFSERGSKEAIGVINAMREAAEQAGVAVGTVFDQLEQKVLDSAGFTARAAAEMSLTPLNQLKSVMSGLQATLVETFDSLEGDVMTFADTMKTAFASDEFRSNLRDLMKLLADLTIAVVNHGRQILEVVAAYMAIKGVLGVLGAVAAAWELWALKATAAVGAVSMAVRVASLANPVLAAITAVVTAGAAGWALYKLHTGEATEKVDTFVDKAPALLEKLQEEEQRLLKINEARMRGITLMELEAEAKLEKARGDEPADLVAARKKLAEFDVQHFPGPRNQLPFQSDAAYAAANNSRNADRKALEDQVNAAEQKHLETLVKIENVADNIKRLREQDAQDIANTQRIKDVTTPRGSLGGMPPTTGKHGNMRDNTLSTLNSLMDKRESVVRNAYENEMRLLEARHRGELVSEGTYQAEVLRKTEAFEDASRQIIVSETEAMAKAYADRKKKIEDEKGLDPEARANALKNLSNDYAKFTENANAALDKVNSDALRRQELAVVSLDSEVKKITKSNDEYWIKVDATAKKEQELADVRQKSLGLSQAEREALEARTKAVEAQSGRIELLQIEYEKASQAATDFGAEMDKSGIWSEEAIAAYQSIIDKVSALGAAIDKSKTKTQELGDVASKNAFKDFNTKEAEQLSKVISEALVDGGKNGAKKLKDWLKNYFIQEPLKVFIQAQIQPYMQQMMGGGNAGGGGMSAMGGGGGGMGGGFNFPGGGGMNLSGGLGSFGSGGGLLGQAGSAFGYNSGTIGGSFASTAGNGLATDAMGATVSEGAAGATLGSAGVGAVSSYVPYIGALYAASQGQYGAAAGMAIGTYIMPGIGTIIGAVLGSLIDSFTGGGGGPKAESTFGSGVPQRGEPTTAKGIADAIQEQYKQLGDAIGGNLGTLDTGVFVSRDPTGDALTQLAVEAKLNGSSIYSRGNRMGGIENVGRSDDELKAAISEEVSRVMLAALQHSDLNGKLGTYVSQLDATTMSVVDMTKALEKIQKSLTERTSLQNRLFELTATAVEKVNKARENEIKNIDDTNLELLKEVHAAENLSAARQAVIDAYTRESTQVTQDLQDAYARQNDSLQANIDGLNAQIETANSAIDASQSHIDSLNSEIDAVNAAVEANKEFGNSLREFVKGLRTADVITPDGSTRIAKIAFTTSLAKAQGGDADARNALTGDASRYLDSLKASSSSSFDYQFGVASLAGQLTGLADSTNSPTGVQQQQVAAAREQIELTKQQIAAGKDQVSALQAQIVVTQQQMDLMKAQMQAVGLLATAQMSFAQALSNFTAAQDSYAAVKDLVTTTQASFAQTLVDYEKAKTDFAAAKLVADAVATRPVVSNLPKPELAPTGPLETSAPRRFGQGGSYQELLAIANANNAKVATGGFEIPSYASGGSHSGGWRLVGEKGPELEYTGPSWIMNNAMTSQMMGGSSDGSMAREMQLLRVEIQGVREATQAVAMHSYKTAKVLKDFSDRGAPVRNPDSGTALTTV